MFAASPSLLSSVRFSVVKGVGAKFVVISGSLLEISVVVGTLVSKVRFVDAEDVVDWVVVVVGGMVVTVVVEVVVVTGRHEYARTHANTNM